MINTKPEWTARMNDLKKCTHIHLNEFRTIETVKDIYRFDVTYTQSTGYSNQCDAALFFSFNYESMYTVE